MQHCQYTFLENRPQARVIINRVQFSKNSSSVVKILKELERDFNLHYKGLGTNPGSTNQPVARTQLKSSQKMTQFNKSNMFRSIPFSKIKSRHKKFYTRLNNCDQKILGNKKRKENLKSPGTPADRFQVTVFTLSEPVRRLS